MRPIYFTVVLLSAFLSTTQVFAVSREITIYGLQSAQHYNASAGNRLYIQLGSFNDKGNALRLATLIRKQSKQSVTIVKSGMHYLVKIGPLHSAAEVRGVSQKLLNISAPAIHQQHYPSRPSNPQPALSKEATTTLTDSWFIAAGVGGQNLDSDESIKVNNGSDFPAPSNLDYYSLNNHNSALLFIEGGYRWQQEQLWLPAYALSLRYKHLFRQNIGGQVTQYSLPEFTNYNYHWHISSDSVLANGKLNVFKSGQFMPFVTAGIGISSNHSEHYYETALSGVTARTSPSFGDHTRSQFTYTLGAGVDWQVYNQILVSAGYEFQNLGKFSSGSGLDSWSTTALHTGNVHSNEVLFSLTYLMNA